MKKLFLALSIITLCATISHADQWARSYGGSDEDRVYSILETSDFGSAWTGFSESFATDSGSNAWVVKLDSNDDIDWEKIYGGELYDWTVSIQETALGYILAGYTESFGAGGADAWIIKLNSDGTVDWEKAYGFINSDEALSIQEITGGYIVAGRTNSFGGVCSDESTTPGASCVYDNDCPPVGEASCLYNSDAWVLELDTSGTIQWQYRYGGNQFDTASCIQEISGGYIVAGDTWSVISGITGDSDIFVMELNDLGGIIWQKTYGDIDDDSASCIQETTDGGYILAGDTRSFGGISKIWVLKLDSDGTISWQKTYGDEWSHASSIKETSDSDFIVAGYTYDYGAGFSDSWLLKLEGEGINAGDILWQKTYGDSNYDLTYSIQETIGGYIMAGTTYSFGAGDSDAWIQKVDSNGDIPACGIISTSTATAYDTSISPVNSSLTATQTNATATITSASIIDTSAAIEQVCPLSGGDSDGDGIIDHVDNCPDDYNPGQEDTMPSGGNSCGDACECEGDFEPDGDVDGTDAVAFKNDFFRKDCSTSPLCNGDFECDGDVDGTDAVVFKTDFFRKDCPSCGGWPCGY